MYCKTIITFKLWRNPRRHFGSRPIADNRNFTRGPNCVKCCLSCLSKTYLWIHARKKNTNLITLSCYWVLVAILKVRIFWEGHKIWKNLPLKIWLYWVVSNFNWKIFSYFVAFSEYPNFKVERPREVKVFSNLFL